MPRFNPQNGMFVGMVHSVLLLTLFAPMCMLGFGLYLNTDANFFSGFWLRLAVLVCTIIVLVAFVGAFFAHVYVPKLPNAFFIASFWIPGVIFASLGGVYRQRTMNLVAELQNPDCDFQAKVDLQNSYIVAEELWQACEKSVPFTPASIIECPQYGEISSDHKAHFSYLRSLEYRFPCSGLCTGGERLWHDAGKATEGCSQYVAEWVLGGYMQGSMMMWYSIFILALSLPLYVLLVPLITEYTGNISSMA